MPTLEAIDLLIKRLKEREKPLPVEKCKKLAKWLEDYVIEHDEELLRDVFMVVKNET